MYIPTQSSFRSPLNRMNPLTRRSPSALEGPLIASVWGSGGPHGAQLPGHVGPGEPLGVGAVVLARPRLRAGRQGAARRAHRPHAPPPELPHRREARAAALVGPYRGPGERRHPLGHLIPGAAPLEAAELHLPGLGLQGAGGVGPRVGVDAEHGRILEHGGRPLPPGRSPAPGLVSSGPPFWGRPRGPAREGPGAPPCPAVRVISSC